MIVGMVVMPWEGKRPVTKTRAIWDQGSLGTGRSCRRPIGDLLEGSFWAQVGHTKTYSQMSLWMDDHQTHWKMWAWVLALSLVLELDWIEPVDDLGTFKPGNVGLVRGPVLRSVWFFALNPGDEVLYLPMQGAEGAGWRQDGSLVFIRVLGGIKGTTWHQASDS